MFADCVSPVCADQRTEGGEHQRLIASARQTETLRNVPLVRATSVRAGTRISLSDEKPSPRRLSGTLLPRETGSRSFYRPAAACARCAARAPALASARRPRPRLPHRFPALKRRHFPAIQNALWLR